MVGITSRGLQEPLGREVSHNFGQPGALLGKRMCFRWTGAPEGPVLHSASRVVPLFSLVFAQQLAELRQQDDLYNAVAEHVEDQTRGRIPKVLAPSLRSRQSMQQLRFQVRCRVDSPGDERSALGPQTDWTRLKVALRTGVEKATGWTLEPRSRDVEVNVVAFLGADYLALGVEAPEPGEERGVSIPWSRVPRPGMDTQLAGAMAALAAEAADPRGGQVVVDLTCGMGTLLLAAERLWKGSPPRLVGLDIDQGMVAKTLANFAACNVEASGIRPGDARRPGAVAEVATGQAEAVLCDLPCGTAHKQSADPMSYDALLSEAARLVRPGGRCVLLSSRRQMLARAVAAGPWRHLLLWSVARDERTRKETHLMVLERL